MERHDQGVLAIVLALSVAPGCRRDEDKPAKPAIRVIEADEVDEPGYPAIDPASVTPLEVFMLPDPVGEGYRRVPIRMSKPLESGKWLGLANGDATFLGPKHIIVNHFSSQPDRLGEGELVKNVLLDVEAGEVVAEFEYGRHVQADFGLAIVSQAGDDRPYLLDVATEKFVLAVPEGEHEYVYGKNYWLRFSPIAKRIWVSARDREGVVHLYAWEPLDAPPELPNNPFPFMPESWDPMDSMFQKGGDTEEVKAGFDQDGCCRAILEPPKGWVCVEDDELLDESWPLSEGWRLDGSHAQVFNRLDGRGYDLSSLCPDPEQPIFASIRRRSPPQLEMRCEGDDGSWMLWTPPDRVRRLDPQYPPRIHTEFSLSYDSDDDRVELRRYTPPEVLARLDADGLVHNLVGADYECADLGFRSGSQLLSGVGCKRDNGRALWFELRSDERNIRSHRFQATEIVVGSAGLAVGVVRRGGRDHVVRMTLGSD